MDAVAAHRWECRSRCCARSGDWPLRSQPIRRHGSRTRRVVGKPASVIRVAVGWGCRPESTARLWSSCASWGGEPGQCCRNWERASQRSRRSSPSPAAAAARAQGRANVLNRSPMMSRPSKGSRKRCVLCQPTTSFTKRWRIMKTNGTTFVSAPKKRFTRLRKDPTARSYSGAAALVTVRPTAGPGGTPRLLRACAASCRLLLRGAPRRIPSAARIPRE
jgi:hypothetical protein